MRIFPNIDIRINNSLANYLQTRCQTSKFTQSYSENRQTSILNKLQRVYSFLKKNNGYSQLTDEIQVYCKTRLGELDIFEYTK